MRKIAVVGAGLSGLTAAYVLSQKYEVTLYEAGGYAGGHANTVDVPWGGGKIPVDAGSTVFNAINYPHFTAMMEHLAIEAEDIQLSYSCTDDATNFGYCSDLPLGLLMRPATLFSGDFWCMGRQILRFNSLGKAVLASGQDAGSLGDFLKQHRFDDTFRQYYLGPLCGILWLVPLEAMLAIPTYRFLKYFASRGLLRLTRRPQWKTARGGSRETMRALAKPLGNRLHLKTPVQRVERMDGGVRIITHTGEETAFEAAILATHADTTLAMHVNATPKERDALGSFRYRNNPVVVHTDRRLMPERRAMWASWNYFHHAAGSGPNLTYWMNNIQHLPAEVDVFVTTNPILMPETSHIVTEFTYRTTIFDAAALQAQSRLEALQAHGRVWYCGGYSEGYGTQEDAVKSALHACHTLGVNAPWESTVKPSGDASS